MTFSMAKAMAVFDIILSLFVDENNNCMLVNFAVLKLFTVG